MGLLPDGVVSCKCRSVSRSAVGTSKDVWAAVATTILVDLLGSTLAIGRLRMIQNFILFLKDQGYTRRRLRNYDWIAGGEFVRAGNCRVHGGSLPKEKYDGGFYL